MRYKCGALEKILSSDNNYQGLQTSSQAIRYWQANPLLASQLLTVRDISATSGVTLTVALEAPTPTSPVIPLTSLAQPIIA